MIIALLLAIMVIFILVWVIIGMRGDYRSRVATLMVENHLLRERLRRESLVEVFNNVAQSIINFVKSIGSPDYEVIKDGQGNIVQVIEKD